MLVAAHKATASAKAAADVGAATAAKMITVQVVTRQTSDNVHMALKRTKYAAAAAANKAAVAGWNVRIGTVAYMPMDNNVNTIDPAVAAANTVAFVRRTNDRKRVSITYHCQILWLQLRLIDRGCTASPWCAAVRVVIGPVGTTAPLGNAGMPTALSSAAAADNATAVAATNNAAAIKTANPTDHQPLMSFRGDAPSATLRPGIVAADPGTVPCSTAADELTGRVRWELAAGG
jgi:hypothetical protein